MVHVPEEDVHGSMCSPCELDVACGAHRIAVQDLCKHGKRVCNRSLNGKSCMKDNCIGSGKLCHDAECGNNKVRPRPSPQARKRAKHFAKGAQQALQGFGPDETA